MVSKKKVKSKNGVRFDSKHIRLRTGESEKDNGTYVYRWTDKVGKRHAVYAPTLADLREQEEQIIVDRHDGIKTNVKNITVNDLFDLWVQVKRGVKDSTMKNYIYMYEMFVKPTFGKKKLTQVKKSDVRRFYNQLVDERILKISTLDGIHNVLHQVFAIAVDDDMIRKNPFKFKLSDVIPNNAYVRSALTKAQQERYLQFIRDHGKDNYYDDIVILLGTGLRVSELYGLTKADIDFDRRCIHIHKQLCRMADKPYFIAPPKTSSGNRSIPMTDTVYMAFRRVLGNRGHPKVEMMVDGYSGFLFLDKDGKPKVAMHLENYMRGMRRKYVKKHGNTLPSVTPHVLRHTFCTNMQQAGIDIKSLQYLMGHSNASVTLDVYTHTDYNVVKRAFDQAAANL